MAHSEAWEKSSIASGWTSTYNGANAALIDVKSHLQTLPAPRNTTEGIIHEQIARLEEDVNMHETEEKSKAELESKQIDEEDRQRMLDEAERAKREEERLSMTQVM